MANRFWVGGGSSANWNATGPTNWGTLSGVQDGASVPSSSDDVFFDGFLTGASNATLTVSTTIKSLDCTGYVNTLTHNSGVTLTISGAGGVFKLVAGMTYTKGNAKTSAVTFTATSGTTPITTGGQVLGNIVLNGSGGTFQLQDNCTSTGNFTRPNGTFDGNSLTLILNNLTGTTTLQGITTYANLTLNGAAEKGSAFSLLSAPTISGTFTLAGNSVTNRVMILSSSFGASRIITAATVVVSNADFKDITGAGAASWDLSAASGGSGDCQGNSGITFTTAANQFWIGGTGNWSTAAEWGTTSGGSGGRTPLPQDGAVFDVNSFSAGSQTVTMDMPRACKDLTWTGATNSPTFSPSVDYTVFGSVVFISAMTFSISFLTTFETRGTVNITSAGKSFNTCNINGTVVLLDAFVCTSTVTLNLPASFDANDFNVTANRITPSNSTTVSLKSGTWTLNGTLLVWNCGTTATINGGTGTIIITDTSASAKTFVGSGKIYNNITFTGNNITVQGSNTFATMAVNNAGLADGLKLTSGTTQTVTGFTTNGSAGNLAILVSTVAGSAATLSKSSGQVSVDFMSIKDSAATGGASWYAGANSTDVSGNSGWIFTAPPGGADLTLEVSDTLALSDAIENILGHHLARSDTLDLSDASEFILGILFSVDDTLGLSDSSEIILGLNVVVDDTIDLSDALASILSYELQFAETIALTEALELVFGFLLDLSDAFVLADDVVVAQSIQLDLSDALELTDAVEVQIGIALEVSDTLSLSDTAELILGLLSDLSDTLGLTDELVLVFGTLLGLSDTLVLTDELIAGQAIQLDLSDALVLSDGLTSTIGFALDLSDTLLFGESLEMIGEYQLIFTDLLDITDIPTAAYGFFFGETLGLIETSEIQLVGADYSLSLSDALVLTDAFEGLLAALFDTSDSLALTDASQLVLGIFIEFSDTLSFTDDLTAVVGAPTTLELTIALADSLVFTDSGAVVASIAYNVSIRASNPCFSDAYLDSLIEQAAVEFSLKIPGIWHEKTIAITPDLAEYTIPDFIKLLDVSWKGVSLDPLIPKDFYNSPETFRPQSGGSKGTPTSYLQYQQGQNKIRFFPCPIETMAVNDAAILDTDLVSTVVIVSGFVHHQQDYEIPTYLFRNVMKYRAMERAYAREGDCQSLKASKYFGEYYKIMFAIYQEVLQKIPKAVPSELSPTGRASRRPGRPVLPTTGPWSW